MSAATRQIGRIEQAARRLDLDGEKRRVALALAAFADEGRHDPTVAELSRRCRVHPMAVVLKLDKLARDGVIAIDRGDDRRRERSTYAFLMRTDTDPKESTMTTTTDETIQAAATAARREAGAIVTAPPAGARPAVPHWQRVGLYPGPLTKIEWPELDEARERHDAACEALASARADEDDVAADDALAEVADAILAADTPLRETIDGVNVEFKAAYRAEVPWSAGGVIETAELDRYRDAVRTAKVWVDHDSAIIARVEGLLLEQVYIDERSGFLSPKIVAEATYAKAATAG